MSILANKRIVLGVTGSIAAYKAAILASQLTQAGAQVDVIMTEAATRFVTPLTFQALTGRPVYTNLWETESGGGLSTHIAHVGLAHEADLLLIAPITANTIARLALGLADNLLTVTALAAACPVVIAPAMDAGMYENAATQGHVATLELRGVHLAGPAMGRMASGLEGRGRFLEAEDIIGHCRMVLGRHGGPLSGQRLIVTAGPTREMLDPVRFLSNRSSGRQGFAIAQAAIDAGADVTLISGPTHLPVPVGAQHIAITSALDLRDAVIAQATGDPQAAALIMSAAVGDFRPSMPSAQKIKKQELASRSGMQINLDENPDILLEVAQQDVRPRVTVGFAAESQDLIAHAQGKLERKKLDLIVANDITATDAGFGVDTNRVHLITADGVEDLPVMGKDEVAAKIVAWVTDRLG